MRILAAADTIAGVWLAYSGCLDHVIVLSERHLRRVLASYIAYYHKRRTHLGLEIARTCDHQLH